MARVVIPVPSRDFDPSEVAIGMRVEVTFVERDGVALPMFRPAIVKEG